MLTEKQEQAIKDKIEFVRIRAERNEPDFSRILKWIVAGIKAYDEIKDEKEVKTASIITGINFSRLLKEGGILKEAEEAEAAVKAASNSKTEEMLLDEAIKHYLDKALDDVSFTCKRDHLRVASWLSELRVRRSRSADGND